MKVIAIVQARMGSVRLPGKVLREIEGKTMLSRVLSRIKQCKKVDEIVLATSVELEDDPVVAECKKLSIPTFRGNKEDVLDRYYQAAAAFKPDVVVRVTGDCPLIDPEVSAQVVEAFLNSRPDYASNTLTRTYPRGLDTEVMSFETLEKTWRNAKAPYQRSHVTPYIYQNAEQFKLLPVVFQKDFSAYRWTVDTEADLQFVKAIYSRLAPNELPNWLEIVRLLEKEPALCTINQSVEQKVLEEG